MGVWSSMKYRVNTLGILVVIISFCLAESVYTPQGFLKTTKSSDNDNDEEALLKAKLNIFKNTLGAMSKLITQRDTGISYANKRAVLQRVNTQEQAEKLNKMFKSRIFRPKLRRLVNTMVRLRTF